MSDLMSETHAKAEPARRPPSAPPAVIPIAAAAIACAIAAAASWDYALKNLYGLIGVTAAPVTILFLVLTAAAWLPIIPAIRATSSAHDRAQLIKIGKVVEARRAAALGRESASTSLGYALAFFVVAALLQFAVTNDGAIAQTFLRGEFIAQAWSEVLKSFWVNVRVALGAEVLVLVLGLIIAIMRMLPGRSGRPLRALAVI